MEEFINKIQYLVGEYSFKFLSSTNQNYSNSDLQKALELSYLVDYFTSDDIENKTELYISQVIDFFEARYNLNAIPYINYPNRVTNILYGGVSANTFPEAPFNNLLYARVNGQWQSFTILDSYTKVESNALYYPLSSNPANYLTSANLSGYVTTATLSNYYTSTQVNNNFYPISSNPAGYITATSLHNAVTLGTSNGLSLIGQVLSLSLASVGTAGAMSISDKTKLDSITVHNPVTIGTANGLSLSTQVLSLANATTLVSGAMSASDKIKLDGLSNYVHPSGFTNQPVSPLTGNTVISRITVNSDGHVIGVTTRDLNLSTVGITAQPLTKTNDTNVTLTLGGTPATSLLEAVSLTLGWTGILSVPRGGTGVATIPLGEVMIGNGVNGITTLSRSGIDSRTSFPPTAHNLTSHSDVNLTTPVINQVLGFNGSVWTNITLSLDDFTYNEIDPIFTAFRDTSRTANTFYSAPDGSAGIGSFRAITVNDIPDVYVRFDINQVLTEAQKSRVRSNIGVISNTNNYELAFSKGNVIPAVDTPLTITNGTGRIVGISDLIITHNTSGWVDKTTLATNIIISNLTIDDFGHVSNWSTRALTLEDLGFVEFNPASLEAAIADHEIRITTLELDFTLLNGDKNYVHLQAVPAAIWTYTHGLGKKPSVTIIDSAGSIILAKITYVDLNNIEIDFDGLATSGEAINN